MPSTPPASTVGRFTGIVLGFVVFVCVTMIGGTGYLKYQLDRAETILAAPENALGSDQDLFDRLRRDWGYGGFLGLIQNYAMTHDPSGIAEMKAHIKSADEIVNHLPDKTSAETRHELLAIATVFDNALQKINSPNSESTADFSISDLTPLYAALPILDSRITSAKAETRLTAQNQVQFWAMLLTLVSWCSLIIAAACTAGIYLTLRDKHAAPMRALAQSIENMARGDMRTAIWGIERQDMIGELARAVDIARYHFSHLPDISLLSEQGPVRMRFEGGARSLFEAMMKAISQDSENIRAHSSSLNELVREQKDLITQMTEKVETVLKNILQRGQNGNLQIGQAINEMIGSAESLKNAHVHAIDQLNRLIPHIGDRAQGLTEITQIAGKQLTQTLQSLAISEINLKANAEDAHETLTKLSTTADDLGERLFGAINLMQASGKLLVETTENVKASLGNTALTNPTSVTPFIEWAGRFDQISNQLNQLQNKLDLQIAVSHVNDKMEPQSNEDYNLTPISRQLEYISLQIEILQTKLGEQAIIQSSQAGQLSAQTSSNTSRNTDDVTLVLSTLSEKIETSQNNIDAVLRQDIGRKLVTLEQALATTQRTVEATQIEAMKSVPPPSYTLPPELQKQFLDQWFQISSQIEASRASLIEEVAEQIDKMETRLAGRTASALPTKTVTDYSTQMQIEKQTQILTELVATLSLLDTHMREIKSDIHPTEASA